MNFGDMKIRAAKLAAQVGMADAYPQPDWGSRVNDGISYFSWEAEFNASTLPMTLVQNQAEYEIPYPPFKYFTDAVLGAAPGTYALIQTTEEQVRRDYPMWLLEPNAIPTMYWMSDPTTLRLFPTPSDGGDTLTIRGVQECPPLVNDTDVPTFPTAYHEGVCLHAAIMEIMVFMSPGGGQPNMLDYYIARRDKLIADCKDWSSDDSAEMQRRVRPASLGRTSLGAYATQRGGR